MKRITLMVILLAFSIAGFAKDIQKDIRVSKFNGIKVSSFFDVTLVKGDVTSVTITVDEDIEPYLRVRVHEGDLHLGLNRDGLPKRFRGNKTLKAVVTMPTINEIELSGATSLYSNDTFNSRQLEVELSGASQIKRLSIEASNIDIEASGASVVNMEVESTDVSVDISGASSCTIEGNTHYAEFDASGASKIDAFDLIATKVNVDLSGASKANVYVTELIELDLSGACTVNYKAPETIRVRREEISRGCSTKHILVK